MAGGSSGGPPTQPVEVRGTPVEIQLYTDETVQVPSGKLWQVTLSGDGNHGGGVYPDDSLDPDELIQFDKSVQLAIETWLRPGNMVESSGGYVSIMGWEVDK